MHGNTKTIRGWGSHQPQKLSDGTFVELYDPNTKASVRNHSRRREDQGRYATKPPCGNNTRGRGNHKKGRKEKENFRDA